MAPATQWFVLSGPVFVKWRQEKAICIVGSSPVYATRKSCLKKRQSEKENKFITPKTILRPESQMERGSVRGEVLYRSHSQHQRQNLTWIFQNPGLSNPPVPCIRDWHSPVPSWSAQGTMEVSADRSVSWSISCNTGVQKAQPDEVQRQIKYRQSLKEVKATDLEAEHLQGHQVLLTYHLPTHLSVSILLWNRIDIQAPTRLQQSSVHIHHKSV